MLRKLLIGGLLFAFLAGPATAQRMLLMPGITYDRRVEFTRHGPVVIHVLTAPRPGGLYGLAPVLSQGTITGREKVTAMQRRASATATVAGVNGDLFNWADGHPSGVLIQSGVLKSSPLAGRSSIGIDGAGLLHVERVVFSGIWQGIGESRRLGNLNQPPADGEVTLFTPDWGAAAPAAPGSFEAVLSPFPAPVPDTDLTGVVVSTAQDGRTPIPADGAVLVARGAQAATLEAEAPVGATLTVQVTLKPDWSAIVDAIGGGPVVVRDGKPIYDAGEAFLTDQLGPRNPRTAVGQLADGRIILVAVDGRQPGYSTGLTNAELAQAVARLGAVTASALDAGGSTTMAFQGKLLNRPSDPGGERSVSEALLVSYYGVYAPPVREPVLSPNGDGVAERQLAAYKLVRPSTVTAKLVGPDGVERFNETATRAPGTPRFAFAPATIGDPPLEGRWHWVVSAVDDQGESSSIDRAFWVNDTLGFLKVRPAHLRLRPGGAALTVTFKLAAQATVTARIETPAGVAVRRFVHRVIAPGDVAVLWNGRLSNGALVHSGRYVVRVATSNAYGRVDLTRPFTVRRAGVPEKFAVVGG